MPDSIHLLDWPKSDKKKINKKLEGQMMRIREIVAAALAVRAEAQIKVRQPLLNLEIPDKNIKADLIELIKEEVNVKAIILGKKLKLNTNITPELRKEGVIRDVVRQLQEMRKSANLKPQHKAIGFAFGDQQTNSILRENIVSILESAKLKNFLIGTREEMEFQAEKEMQIDDQKLWLAIKKT